MNIVFFANGKFAIPTIKELHLSDNNLLKVVSNIDKRGGRGKKIISTPVSKFCKDSNIPLLNVDNLHSDTFLNDLKNLKADIFIVVSYKIIPQKIYSIPKYKTINIHASLLPSYKGAAPIQRSLENGEENIGLSIFEITTKVDSGRIINQKSFKIKSDDTYSDIHDLLSIKAADFLIKTLPLVKEGKMKIIENLEPSFAPKIKKNELKISLNNSSFIIHNKFRAFTPPGGYLYFDNKKIKIFKTNFNKDNSLSIGEWSINDDILHIGCKEGSLLIEEVQFEGKKRITVSDFKNSNKNEKIKFE
tara:strand:- start:20 stop:928 length:909 start_codon:yes stop_codon:yes gene_type:complete